MIRRGISVLEVLIAICILGVLFALGASAVMRMRAAALRTVCGDRLRQLAMACQHHHSSNGQFPQGTIARTGEMAHASWVVQLLPGLDQSQLWHDAVQAYRIERVPFRNPPHTGLATPLKIVMCPSDDRVEAARATPRGLVVAFTSFLGVSGDGLRARNGVLFGGSRVAVSEITDGASNTVMIGERPPSHDLHLGWWYAGLGLDGDGNGDCHMDVRNVGRWFGGDVDQVFRPSRVLDPVAESHFWSLHSGGGHFAFADGAVRFLSYNQSGILPALATRAGGEAVKLD